MGVSYYSWEVKYPNLTPLEAGTVQGYIAQALGSQFSFLIALPKISYSKLGGLQQTQAIFTTQAYPIGATSIRIKFATPLSNILAAGDFIGFQNHSKVYQAVAAVQAEASGNATIFFSCPLQSAVPNNTQVYINGIYFTAVLAENVQEWDVGVGGLTSLSLQMREVW